MIASLSILIMTAGLLFMAIAAVGAIRLPDFYTRAHAIGVTDTLGTLLLLSGLALAHGLSITAVKLCFVVLFVYLANPTITHILVRAALLVGLVPWTRAQKDGPV